MTRKQKNTYPWVADGAYPEWYVCNSEGAAVARVEEVGWETEEVEANAKLMAAAPELLEACKYVLGAHQGEECDENRCWCMPVRRAIAKAEGA